MDQTTSCEMKIDSTVQENAATHTGRRWFATVMVLALVVPLLWGCPDGVDAPPPTRVEAPQLELNVSAEDVRTLRDSREDYSRPEPEFPRNPFRPDLSVLGIDFEDEVVDDDAERRQDPLTRYPLGAYELVAVISETATPRAMFIDPSGDGHFALVGMELGTPETGGRVSSIRSGDLENPAEVDVDRGDAGVETVALSEVRLRPPTDEDTLAEETRAVLEMLGVPPEEQEELGRELQRDGELPTDDELPQLAPPGQD